MLWRKVFSDFVAFCFAIDEMRYRLGEKRQFSIDSCKSMQSIAMEDKLNLTDTCRNFHKQKMVDRRNSIRKRKYLLKFPQLVFVTHPKPETAEMLCHQVKQQLLKLSSCSLTTHSRYSSSNLSCLSYYYYYYMLSSFPFHFHFLRCHLLFSFFFLASGHLEARTSFADYFYPWTLYVPAKSEYMIQQLIYCQFYC